MTARFVSPAFIMVAAAGGPQWLPQVPAGPDRTDPGPGSIIRRAGAPGGRGPNFRGDLVLGLVGFALGAASLSFANIAQATPTPPVGETRLLSEAAMSVSPTHFRRG